MARVSFRVHGPYLHRRQWRLDIRENGKRFKISYANYAEAVQAALEFAQAGTTAVGNGSGNHSDPQPSDLS